MSRLDLYQTALELYPDEVTDLQENDLYYKSCIRFELDGQAFLATGFNGKNATYIFAKNNTAQEDDKQTSYFVTPSGAK